MRRLALLLVAIASLAVACASKSSPTSVFDSPGPFAVGHSTFLVLDSAHGRSLPTEVWYPAPASETSAAALGEPIEDFLLDTAERATFVELLTSAANPGTRRRSDALRDLPVAAGTALLPVVAFSHCYDCLRFSSFSVAERMASFGMVVLAPDHVRDTLFDAIAGIGTGITPEFLQTRAYDISAVLDAALDPASPAMPSQLRGRLDPARVGVFGHSYGGATVGLVLKEDLRMKAGAALAAPPASVLFPAVTMADIHVPLFLLVAEEDNSIGVIGNNFIGDDFAAATVPTWMAQVADAGHWSFSDICGLTSEFPAGCTSPATRQTTGAPFTYLPIDQARGIAASYLTAFFAWELSGDPRGAAALESGRPGGVVSIEANGR